MNGFGHPTSILGLVPLLPRFCPAEHRPAPKAPQRGATRRIRHKTVFEILVQRVRAGLVARRD
ncbi:hypothetical protein SAMN04488103_10121 [Gemmobacter aquatilis]|uniref:Transposase n=1 Tax=Gemmobacter aquatilis TaxID=933059 RepID=A0A1H7Y2V8_9RHOB|nr:hypothetical protein [Gemmobacter aquatilis]SEM39509.1 hypothetical protein SAMN04488103_10121 [Gemmobacter aquatilis]